MEIKFFFRILKEVLSEFTPDGKVGKAYSKRVVIMMFTSYFIYSGIYCLHSNSQPDDYVITLDVVFLLLSLRVLLPEQADSLLDKLKDLDPIKKIKTETKTEIEQNEKHSKNIRKYRMYRNNQPYLVVMR